MKWKVNTGIVPKIDQGYVPFSVTEPSEPTTAHWLCLTWMNQTVHWYQWKHLCLQPKSSCQNGWWEKGQSVTQVDSWVTEKTDWMYENSAENLELRKVQNKNLSEVNVTPSKSP